MLTINKMRDIIAVSYNGEEVTFDGLPRIRKSQRSQVLDADGAEISRDTLLFAELNKYWSTLPVNVCEEIYQAYALLAELSGEDESIIKEHIGKVVATLEKYHTTDVFAGLYPPGKIFIPEKLETSFDTMSPNYTADMTYVVEDYYQLVLLTMTVKPFVPVAAVMGAYIGGKGLPQELKRKVVDNINNTFDLIKSDDFTTGSAITKLRLFLNSLVEKFQKEVAGKNNSTSLSVLSALYGYGTDMLDEYLLALTVIRLLGLRPCYGDYNAGMMEDSSIVSTIYFDIKAEVTEGYANRISGKNVVLKPHPTNVVFNGEKGKVSAIDLVRARSRAPIKEFERTGVAFMDYRRFVKQMGIDIPPADVKTLITSIETHHVGPNYELYKWLVSVALGRFIERRTLHDITPECFAMGMGIAQAAYIHYGMYEVAQLLSCEMVPGNISGYPIEPLDTELKNSVDRYYPQAYRSPRNVDVYSPVRTSLDVLIKECISPYFYHLHATPEAAALLRCHTDVANYQPGRRLLTELAEFLAINARLKLKEVEFFNK